MSANALFDLQSAAHIALRCLDLTSLNDADTAADIAALCQRAQTHYGPVAAVCVWPRFVAQVRSLLPPEIRVAAVANFPAGALDIARTLSDVQQIRAAGGNEVDVVLPYSTLIQVPGHAQVPQIGQSDPAQACADFLAQVRAACGPLTLKVIIESGALSSPALIAQATRLAIAAGADFVKTSTGKTPVSATPEAAAAMLGEIARTGGPAGRKAGGRTVGFKASGGIRTVADTLPYLALVAEHLGPAALAPERFRIGASSLLVDIVAVLAGNTTAEPAQTTHDAAPASPY
jgi:deoxyribose-phosphate aldolase